MAVINEVITVKNTEEKCTEILKRKLKNAMLFRVSQCYVVPCIKKVEE